MTWQFELASGFVIAHVVRSLSDTSSHRSNEQCATSSSVRLSRNVFYAYRRTDQLGHMVTTAGHSWWSGQVRSGSAMTSYSIRTYIVSQTRTLLRLVIQCEHYIPMSTCIVLSTASSTTICTCMVKRFVYSSSYRIIEKPLNCSSFGNEIVWEFLI